MTRGKLVLYTQEKTLYSSTEFNGDMYFDGHGKLALDLMNTVETLDDFNSAVEYFNSKTRRYDEQLVYKCAQSAKYLKGFRKKDYFEFWFSDYLYFKNASTTDIITKDYDGNSLIIPASTAIILNFGKIYIPSEEEKKSALGSYCM